MDLLDVGCGPASITADLAELVAPGRVVALDSSPSAIEAARATLAARGLLGGVELAVGDAFALPFEDGAFDVVHAHQVLQHVHDPVAALKEMATWAERCFSSFGPRACELDLATAADLQAMAEGWRQWGASDDGWFAVVHGEILGDV